MRMIGIGNPDLDGLAVRLSLWYCGPEGRLDGWFKVRKHV